MDSIIEDVRVRKILDSRGNPTVEVDILTWNGFGRAAAPSGASTGSREVVSFPQGGVDKIISEVEDVISSELIGMAAEDLADIDYVLKEIDGTDNMSAIGGNTTVAVSMAAAKAAAATTSIGRSILTFLALAFFSSLAAMAIFSCSTRDLPIL